MMSALGQTSSTPQFYPARRQTGTSNDSRVSQLDQDVRGAFNNRFNGQEPSGTAVVPAISIQPGSTIITPPQTRTVQVEQPGTVTQVQPQHGGLDVGASLSAKGFMQNIFSPQLLTPSEASSKLTPKLITPQIQQSVGGPAQQQGQLGNGLDARQMNNGLGGLGGSSNGCMYPQQNAYGQQPVYGGQQGLYGQHSTGNQALGRVDQPSGSRSLSMRGRSSPRWLKAHLMSRYKQRLLRQHQNAPRNKLRAAWLRKENGRVFCAEGACAGLLPWEVDNLEEAQDVLDHFLGVVDPWDEQYDGHPLVHGRPYLDWNEIHSSCVSDVCQAHGIFARTETDQSLLNFVEQHRQCNN